MLEVLCEFSSCQHLDDIRDDDDAGAAGLREKGDLRKKELGQAQGAKSSSDTCLLWDLGQVPALLWVSFLTCEFGLVRGPSLQGGREPECTELPLGRWAAQRVSLVSLGQQVRTTAFLWAQFWLPTSGGPCGPASLLLQQRGGSQRATWSTCPWRDQSCWAWAKLNPPGHLLYR